MENSINVVLLHTKTYIITVTTQPLSHIHIVHRWEIVCNRYIRRHMVHTHGTKQPPHIFYTLFKILLPTFFYGHFNTSSFCDIKYTLVGTERQGARENGREKQ